MDNLLKSAIVLLALACFLPDPSLVSKKVLLTSVETLTLHDGKFTTGQRSSPVPQLRCIDGKSRCKHLPSAVQCYNKGSDGIDVQWKCEAQLPSNVQFDTLQVQCEGYDYADDPYVLAGSCGLTYSLKPAGSRSGGSGHSSHSRSSSKQRQRVARSDEDSGWSLWLLVGAVVCMMLIYAVCLAPGNRQQQQQQQWSSDSGAEAPPPYSSEPPPTYGFRPEYTAPGPSAGPKWDTEPQGGGGSGSGGGGFWTGAAVGGLAGYLFGSSRRTPDCPAGDYGSRPVYRQSYRDSSSSSSDSAGGSPVTSSGYASTRRR